MGQVTQEVFKDVVGSWRKKIREAKGQLELNLANSVKDNKKCFYKYINSKTRGKGNLHSLLDTGGNTVTKDEEEAEVLNTFFTSVFSKTGGPQNNWPSEVADRDGEQNSPPVIHNETASELLRHLDAHKSMETQHTKYRIHARVMR